MMKTIALCMAGALSLAAGCRAQAQTYLGQYSANPHAPKSTAAPAQRFAPDSVTNP
jgi:hypothetical protein